MILYSSSDLLPINHRNLKICLSYIGTLFSRFFFSYYMQSKIRVPGFTGEYSLYNTNKNYHSVKDWIHGTIRKAVVTSAQASSRSQTYPWWTPCSFGPCVFRMYCESGDPTFCRPIGSMRQICCYGHCWIKPYDTLNCT